VGGIGASILNIPIMATITRWFVIRRGLMTGIVQAGAGIGGFFLAPFSGWLILNYGWRTAAVIMGCFTATLMVLAGLFLIRDPGDIGQSPDGVLTDTPRKRPSRNNTAHSSTPPLRTYLRTAPFWMLTGIFASFGYIRSTFTARTAAHVQDFGYSLSDGANVLALISMGSVIGRIGMGRLADMIGSRRTLIISYAVLALVIVWLMTSADLWQFYGFGMIYGFGWGALAVLRFAITAQVFGLASVGFMMGILGFSESVAATFSSKFGGFIFDLSGDYTTAFGMCLAVSCLGLFLSWRLK
jgi:MFS family permease